MPMMALSFTRWSKAVMRVIERAGGIIPGCKPMGTNKGMIGDSINPSSVDQWLKQMAVDINKMREARGAKALVCRWADTNAKPQKQKVTA